MTIIQEYTREEDGFGEHTFRFVLTDSYPNLFKQNSEFLESERIITDIFVPGNVKGDLNTDDGSYAIDELPIDLDTTLIIEEDDRKAAEFIRQAVDIRENRYCALFFDPDYTSYESLIAQKWFIGKVNNKYSGEDTVIDGDEYDSDIDPEREYSYAAYSFDISILNNVKTTKPIKNSAGTVVDPLIEDYPEESRRISDAEIEGIFEDKLCTVKEYDDSPGSYRSFGIDRIGTLYDAIRLLFDKAEDIILEFYGDNLSLALEESDLGINTSPVYYDVTDHFKHSATIYCDTNNKVRLKISPTAFGSDWSNPYIHAQMLLPGYLYEGENNENFVAFKNLSFLQYDNLAELLYGIAKSFGGSYIFAEYKSGNILSFKFVSRSAIVDDDFTLISDWTNGSIDVQSTLAKGATRHYGQSCKYAMDGKDSPVWIWDTKNNPTIDKLEFSNDLENFKVESKDEEKVERSLLTTSPTMLEVIATDSSGNHAYSKPINFKSKQSPGNPYSIPNPHPILHSGVYIKSLPILQEIKDLIGASTEVWRPSSYISMTIDGEEVLEPTLTDINNILLAYDKQYYETEYQLTIPSWSGFMKDSSGSSPSFKNIERGSKIRFRENNRFIWNDNTESWDSVTDTKDYVVVGIERNTDYPETIIKLHNLSRFAISPSNSGAGVIKLVESEDSSSPNQGGSSTSLSAGEQVMAMHCGMLDETTGEVVLGIPHKNYSTRKFGIILADAISGEFVDFITSGRVDSPYFYNFTPGYQVFCRLPQSSGETLNISQDLLDQGDVTTEEDMIVLLGIADSETSFWLDPKVLIWR
jgi:hypothetical protein